MWLQTRILSVTTLSINSSKMFSVLNSKRVHVDLVDLATWKLLDKKNNHNKILFKCDLLGETVTSVPWPQRSNITVMHHHPELRQKLHVYEKWNKSFRRCLNTKELLNGIMIWCLSHCWCLKKGVEFKILFKCYRCSCALSVLSHHSLTNI